MTSLYILYEHASGYSLFKVKEFEDIGRAVPKIEASLNDINNFTKIVKLVSFSPFINATVALENVNNITEGVLSETLHEFLAKYLPKEGITLGLSDVKLAPGIGEAFKVKCQVSGVVPEIVRGIRQHFHNFIEGFSPQAEGIAYLGLGHSYSRAKIKFNVHRTDNMIIQSIALLDQLDKDVNTFSMRIREWYSYHFPELYKIVPENYLYAKAVQYIKNRKDLDESKLEGLEEILMDSGKAQSILNASRHSMGMDIQPLDLININSFVKRLISLADYRKELAVYLHEQMKSVAPNLSELIGDQVGARLISHAGSLTNLAKYPASTIQILGAEKALFRALKTRSNTPKYGLIFHSTFIGRANAKNKGRVSRFLANKCSIASRIDCFSDTSHNVFGEKLRQQVEDRLKFYETGEKPKKNVDVMEEAIGEVATLEAQGKTVKKKKIKKRTDEMEFNENGLDKFTINGTEELQAKKKVNESAGSIDVDETKKEKKKKKKKKKNKNSESLD